MNLINETKSMNAFLGFEKINDCRAYVKVTSRCSELFFSQLQVLKINQSITSLHSIRL